MNFPRIERLPPYVFDIIGDLTLAVRRAGEDVIDLGMGNPDAPPPPHVLQKLVESAGESPNHRYSVPQAIYELRVAIELSKFLWQEAKVAVSRGIGVGACGDEHVRFAPIANEHRTRQAARGIRNALGGSAAGAA